jgi:hypothetical protein
MAERTTLKTSANAFTVAQFKKLHTIFTNSNTRIVSESNMYQRLTVSSEEALRDKFLKMLNDMLQPQIIGGLESNIHLAEHNEATTQFSLG